MESDPNVICYGLGVPDPMGVFGTTVNLQEAFGEKRVFDMPTSENAMLGVGIGAAMTGLRPVLTSQRVDFILLAMDQLINNAAKWHYMFGGGASVPFTLRLIAGRGWGQGPTHSQNLQAWFAHIPGLKVVMPTTPSDAKGLLLSSIFDDDPVVFIEHRWLHNAEEHVDEAPFRLPIGQASVRREGGDITIVSMAYMTAEAVRAADYLKEHGVACEVLDLRSIRPLDWDTIFRSVRKTGRLLALDTGILTCSVSSDVVAHVTERAWDDLKGAPQRIALPDTPTPTSRALTRDYYPRAESIVERVCTMLGKTDISAAPLTDRRNVPHDVPGDWFGGPF
jgi:pyruvate dehydrogenase E1 component beta subunit